MVDTQRKSITAFLSRHLLREACELNQTAALVAGLDVFATNPQREELLRAAGSLHFTFAAERVRARCRWQGKARTLHVRVMFGPQA